MNTPADLLLLAADETWRSGPDLADRACEWGAGLCPSNIGRYLATLAAEGLLACTEPVLARMSGEPMAEMNGRTLKVYRLTPAGRARRARLEVSHEPELAS